MILENSERCTELAEKVQERFIQRSMSLGTAESCTGGLLAAILTHIPGSSSYFIGGINAYSNSVKLGSLAVKKITLEQHGAVSQETAIEMAKGALVQLECDYSIAITGIAGPGGGTETKPVGTIYLALAGGKEVLCKKFKLGSDRLENRSTICHLALTELITYTEVQETNGDKN